MKLNFSMADKYFQSKTDNSETKMTNFFQSVCTNSVSINLIVSELNKEKIKRSTLDNDKREMKCKMKELVEKLNATEILIDISNAAIQVLEKTIKDSGNRNAPWARHDVTPSLSLIPKLERNGTLLSDPIGSFNATAATSGTTIKFNPPIDTDEIKKGGVYTNISTMLHCITCMKEYENKSLEELRMEDYSIHKGGAGLAVGIGFENTTQNAGDLFGRNAAASTSAFSFSNTTQSKSMFDTTGATNTFGSSGGLFRQPVETRNPGLFGKSAPFTAATPAFSFGASTGTSLVQENNLQKPLFGQTARSTGFFGSTATTQQSTGFGTNTAILSSAAKSRQKTGLFGAKPTGFISTNTATTTNSFSFESNNVRAGGSGLFGQKPADTAFGTGTTAFGTLSSGFGIAKTPETNKLERSRCDSENTASPDIDGDLEREVMGDFKPLIPLPAEVVVETGEENELVLFEDRAKLYRFVDQEWKERGTGIVKILHHNASGRVRLLMRRDQVLKVCANHYMSSNMEISPLKSSDRAWTWVAQDFADEVLRPEHFCIRFKTAELAASFKAAFDKAINIVKETESKKVSSPKVSVTESAPVVQKGFGSQFAPKTGSWSCPTCYVSNTADKLSCVACATRKIPIVSNANHVSTTVASAATVQSPIVSFKATSGINQFQFKSPASTQSGGFTFGSTTLSSDSATQNKFGGFTFSSSPTITETPEPSIKDREILVVSTKDTKSPQVSKIDQPTSSPFSGFSFGKSSFPSDLSIQVSDTSRSVTVTSEKPTSFSELASKPFATAVTPTFSAIDGNASSLSKMQSMIQNVKPAFTLEPNNSPKTPDTSIVNASQKVSTNASFGTTSAPQTTLNNNRLSTDGSPEEFIPTAEFKPVVPLPALVDIKTGEEEDEIVFEERAKLFRYDPTTKEWKERGTGVLKILYLKHSHKYRILMRRDQVLKICANHYILPEMKLEPKSDKSWVWFSQDYSEEELEQQQFAVRFKTVDIAKKFQTVFLDCQAKLKETKPKDTVSDDKCKGNSAAFEKLVGESKINVSEKITKPEKEKPLSELFKPDAGSWECNVCYVRNKSGDSKCVSCESPNPSSTAAPQTTSASILQPLFSSASKTTGGFGDLFKPKEGTWECKSCYVRNSADKTKCVSCDTENATSSTTKPASSVFGTSGSNAFGAFKFGSSNTPKSTFTFGTPKSESGFVFGSKPESQLATFTFGQSTISTNANETTSNNSASIFGGVSQKVSSEKGNASEQGIFGSATNFSFADLAKSHADSGEFTFGSPQKYEFSFDGVRPHSPSKAPKSPRSPAAPSDADEEDEVEDSEADNLYFEPVIPLPPKVEVKTGEEEEKVLFCKRAKLFRFSNSEWKERGLGDIKILLDEKTNRVRLLMRREQVLKVCLNHHLTKDMKFEWRNDKSLSWTATDFSENEPSPELFAVKFKTTEYAEEFKKAIDDALKVSSQPAQSPKSENISLKPASTFSFKTNDPVKVEPQGFSFGSLSSRFGGSPQQSQTVFGSAATGFSFKDSTAGSGASQFSFSLKDNSSNSPFFNKSSVFGGFGVAPLESKDDDIEVVYEPTVPEEKVKLAEKLQLPKFFFLYDNKPSCPGCIGCEDKIPPYKTIESQESAEKTSTPDTNATPKSSTVTQESSMPFSSSSFSTFSFSDIASNTGFEKLAKSPASGKTVFAGAGTPLFQNLNTSAEEGTDEVAPNPDIHFEPVIPLPDLIEVKTGEEDETPLFIFRAKLFRYDPNTKQWKERGIGDIKILSHKEKMRFRIILRRDQVHNVACNHCITEEMSLTPLSTSENALCWTAMDFSDGKGEATQFAVRFKHKEQTQQFKEVFLDCQEKLRNCKQTSVEEKVAAIAQNAEPVGASGGASAAEESVTEDEGDEDEDDDEEESEELLFEKRVTLEVFDDAENKFKVEGMGYLKIVYDDSSFGYRVFMEADDGRLLCEHLIAVQTCLRTDGKTAIWAAIDYCMEPVTRRQFRVTFSSMEALNEFSKHFEEGKEIAIKSPIVEKSD